MTYLERLKINRQGFFLVTGQLISAATFQEVSLFLLHNTKQTIFIILM